VVQEEIERCASVLGALYLEIQLPEYRFVGGMKSNLSLQPYTLHLNLVAETASLNNAEWESVGRKSIF
jgi:hypothetical protein